MGATAFFFLLLFLWVQNATATDLVFARSDFPQDFVFGAGTSRYQVSSLFSLTGKFLCA
jgi:beta-glucosidase